MKFTDADRLAWDPFEGERDVKIKCKTVKIVTTKSAHKCIGIDGAASAHGMPAGTRARSERALVDGEWGSYYICVDCMDRWLSEFRPVDSRSVLKEKP